MTHWTSETASALELFRAVAPLAQAVGDEPPAMGNQFIFIFLLIGFAFYFIVMRPQRQEQRKRDEMLNKVSKGDKVVTIGGIHGSVEAVQAGENTVTIVVAPKTSLKVNRSAIASVVPKGKGKEEGEEKEKDKEAK